MLKRAFQLFFILLGGTLGFLYIPILIEYFGINLTLSDISIHITGMVSGALILFLSTVWFLDSIIRWLKHTEEFFLTIPIVDLLFGIIGLILGLVVATLLSTSVDNIPVVKFFLPILLAVLLGYFGFKVGYNKREELVSILSFNIFSKDKGVKKELALKYENKILDTSVIIDGRIADICKTGFIDGKLIIPGFVLEELQHIADSADTLKRNRGRRGLDILNKIRKELDISVVIYEGDFEEVQEVDSKLVKLAKKLEGKVVTNDYNLNKVCELQGVPVLNINDLSNAVKPIVLPGEEMNVQVIKDGKEHNQGIAYLDDGTMIVVEGGREYINHHIDVLVTSVLQTSAGRMIFAKPKLLEKAL
ncbi:MAG: PIN/TRAM domain-containing protein [Vulcanibacillus sp.]